MNLLTELLNLKEQDEHHLIDRLASDIRDNWMGLDEEDLQLLVKRELDGALSYLKHLPEDELEGVVYQAWYDVRNQYD